MLCFVEHKFAFLKIGQNIRRFLEELETENLREGLEATQLEEVETKYTFRATSLSHHSLQLTIQRQTNQKRDQSATELSEEHVGVELVKQLAEEMKNVLPNQVSLQIQTRKEWEKGRT